MSADATMEKIGERLSNIRWDKRLTQAEVAKKVGTETNYYGKIERGEATPSLKMFEKIVKALGAKSSDILPF